LIKLTTPLSRAYLKLLEEEPKNISILQRNTVPMRQHAYPGYPDFACGQIDVIVFGTITDDEIGSSTVAHARFVHDGIGKRSRGLIACHDITP